MKNTLLSAFTVVAVMILYSCGTPSKSDQTKVPDMHNSQNSLDWAGTYKGVLPCADCEGMQMVIQLKEDGNYRTQARYLGTKEKNTWPDSGSFTWNKEGQVITLENGTKYFVGENRLIQLDREGNKITGSLAAHYVLTKVNGQLKETYWRLVGLNGSPIRLDSSFSKKPYIILKGEDNRIFGNAGCNQISGTYKLEEGNKISFSQMISTKMACPNLGVEDRFMEAMEKTDHYSLDGEELVLLHGNKPIIKFKAVYFH